MKLKKFMRVFLLYVMLMLADGGLTLYNTPDLSMEANPLVTKLHLGWGALITVNLIFFAINYGVCRFTFDTYETIIADVPNVIAYSSLLFYNRPDKTVWLLYKFPKNWKPFWASFGYCYMYSLCIGAVVRVLEWLAYTLRLDTYSYDLFSSSYVYGRMDMAVGLISIIPLMCIWLWKEYRKSCTAVKADNQSS